MRWLGFWDRRTLCGTPCTPLVFQCQFFFQIKILETQHRTKNYKMKAHNKTCAKILARKIKKNKNCISTSFAKCSQGAQCTAHRGSASHLSPPPTPTHRKRGPVGVVLPGRATAATRHAHPVLQHVGHGPRCPDHHDGPACPLSPPTQHGVECGKGGRAEVESRTSCRRWSGG